MKILTVAFWPLAVALLSGQPLFAQTPSLTFTQSDIAVAPGYNHVSLHVGVSFGGNTANELGGLTVTSDSTWVRGSIDTASAQLVLTFTTANLINRSYTATVSVANGGAKADFFVRATVAPLSVSLLVRDPFRSRVYGLQQDGLNTGCLLVLNPSTLAPIANLTLGKMPTDLAINTDGSELLAINAVDHSITAIDLRTLTMRETIPLSAFYESGHDVADAQVDYGAGDILYYTDRSWGPVLHVYNRATHTTLQSLFIDGSAYAGAGNATHGFGDIVVNHDKTALLGWSQYGWNAGIVSTWPARFTIGGDGKLTLASTHTWTTDRDPLNTPAFISPDGALFIFKQFVVDAAHPDTKVRSFPSPVYAVSPGLELVCTSTAIFDSTTGNKLYTLPATTTVQTITADYTRLIYFETTTKSIKSVNLLDALGATVLRRDSSPADHAIVLAPAKLQWTALAGIDHYRVYLGESAAAVTAAGPASPEFLANVTGSSLTLSQSLTAGKTYYWRVDVLADNEASPGPVQSFTVSTIASDTATVTAATVQGHADLLIDVALSSANPGKAWSASSTANWVKFIENQGTTPSTLHLRLDASALEAGVASASIKITGPDDTFTIPVKLEVDPLMLTVMRSSPTSGLVYAISEDTTATTPHAYLLEIDSAAEAIKRVLPVGSSATDLAIHPGDGRIYVTNWRGGSLLAVNLAGFSVERSYSFAAFGGIGYGDGDVYRVSAGGAGRIVVEEYDQWIQLGIYDTTTGTMLGQTTSLVREGGGQYAPDLRYYYHGESNSSDAHILKFDTLADRFSQVASGRGNLSSYYGSRTVVVSDDGRRIFWSSSVYNSDLVEQWAVGEIVYCASADGRYAFGENKIYDVVDKKAVYGMPVATKVSAFNSTAGKLILQQGPRLAFYALNSGTTLPSPVLSLSARTAGSVTLTWTEAALQNGFTLQYRASGATAWTDVPGPLTSTLSTYTLNGLAAETAYEARLKAEGPSTSSAWSNIVAATTLPTPPATPYFLNPSALSPTSIQLSWTMTDSYDTITVERGPSYYPASWTVVATLPSPATSYLDPNLTPLAVYTYRLKATRRGSDSAYSQANTVELQPAAAPGFVRWPESRVLAAGNYVYYSVNVSGNPPPTLQWYRNGVAIPGATAKTFEINSASTLDSGTYTVVATSSLGTVTSPAFTLTVTPSSCRIVNLSVLEEMTPGETLTVGFTISGGPKSVLVRALGPTLSAVGVSNVLPDPKLTLYRQTGGSGVALMSNDDWSSGDAKADVRLATATLTGLPFISEPSHDAAVYPRLSVDGGYSARVSDTTASPGYALVEVYDGNPASASSRLANISALSNVGAGHTLTAGFVLTGAGSRKVLIRGVGPSLARIGVTHVLADPKIALHSQGYSYPVLENDDWHRATNKAEIISISGAVTGLALDDNSKDAAIVTTLSPGLYSAVLSSTDNTSGLAIIEVYDVP